MSDHKLDLVTREDNYKILLMKTIQLVGVLPSLRLYHNQAYKMSGFLSFLFYFPVKHHFLSIVCEKIIVLFLFVHRRPSCSGHSCASIYIPRKLRLSVASVLFCYHRGSCRGAGDHGVECDQRGSVIWI